MASILTKRWRRIIAWTLAVADLLIVVAGVGGYLFLRSPSFQRYAISTIVKDTDQATGGRAEIGNFDFQLSTLTAHLYNITLHGTESSGQPPLLHVDKLTVGLKIRSILRRKVTLSELAIERPVMHVRVDAEGKSNIPHAPPSPDGGHTNIFDLEARHVLLTDGEINYNDDAVPLTAEVYDLHMEIGFDWLATRYRGSISYDNGRIRYANTAPLQHSLDAKFSATPSRFSLESAALNVGSSVLSLHADLANYQNPTVEGDYNVRLHTQDFAALAKPVTTAGDVTLSGEIHYQNANDGSLLRSLSIVGQMASETLAVRSADGRLDLHKLQGRYQLADGKLEARDVVFETLGGKVTSEADVEHLDTTPVARIRTALNGISLQAVQREVRGATLHEVVLLGRVDGTARASWTGRVSDLRAHADLNIRSGDARHSANAIPVAGAVHVSYDGPKNTIAFRQTTIRMPSTTVVVQGQVSNHSNLQIAASANDLRQLAALISAVRGGQSGAVQVSGSASANAVLQGSMRKPALAGQLSAQNLLVRGSQWSSVAFKFQANPSQVALQNAVLVNAHQGKAVLNAKVELHDWAYLPSSSLAVNLSVQRLAMRDLERLTNLQYPISGDLSAELSLQGSQVNPSGNGTARVENVRAYGEPVQRLAATFRANKNSVTSTLNVNLPAGTVNGTVSYTPKSKAYTVRLNAPSIVLQKLQTVQVRNLGITGTLKLSASGAGTLDDPQLTAEIEAPQLQIRDKSISQIKASLQVANHRAEMTLDSEIAQASVHSHGTVNLTGDYYTEAAIDTSGVPLDPLLVAFVPNLPQGFQGEAELHATVKGPLKDKSRIEAHLTIPILKAKYQSLEIGAQKPIHVDYSNSVITLQPAEISGTDTSLRIQGSYPLAGNMAPNLFAQGSVDLRILRMIEPDAQSSGTLSLNVHASGSASNPTIQGQIRLQNAALSSPEVPLGVEKLNGTFDIGSETVQISSLAGEVGGGQMSAGGSISYRPNLQFNVHLQGKSVRLLYPSGLRTVLDGNLMLSGTEEASTLNGRVLIDSLSFTPDFDLSKFSDQFNGTGVPAEPGVADNVKLAIAVQSKGDLSANSSQVSIEGQVNLQVIGSAANPVIIGRTDVTSGELFYRNVRYQLDQGLITFNNPTETEPLVNVSATTTIEQYNLTLKLRGSFDKLVTSYTSDPPLATADIINLIAQGHTTQEQNPASQSTDSIIASQVTGQVTGGIQQLAGISSLEIDPLLGGNNQNPSARVAIQQRVTKNLLFTFSTDLSQPGSEIVQGDYQINKRWSVSLTRDEVGGVSVDGKFHTKF